MDDEVRAVLAAGLAWLFDTEQPGVALLQHHGVSRRAGERLYQFAAGGRGQLPVIVISVVDPVYEGPPGNRRLVNPLGGAEMAEHAAALAELGYPPIDQWNGKDGHDSGTFRLGEPAHPTLDAAVTRYHAGCPIHGTVFCGWQRQGLRDDEPDCTWYRDHYAHVVQPAWPQEVTA